MSDIRDTRDEPTTDRMTERTPLEEERAGTTGESMNRNREIETQDMREPDPDRMTRERSMPASAREPVMADASTSRNRGMDSQMWPDMTDLRHKFDVIQSEFIDDPKSAVKKAEELVKELVDRITRSMNERMDTMHRGVEKSNDTEQLRQTMKSYRDLVDWMETRRAA